MPSGVTCNPSAITGTAVFTTVESSACMKNAADTKSSKPRKRTRVEVAAAVGVSGTALAAVWASAGSSGNMAGMVPVAAGCIR